LFETGIEYAIFDQMQEEYGELPAAALAGVTLQVTRAAASARHKPGDDPGYSRKRSGRCAAIVRLPIAAQALRYYKSFRCNLDQVSQPLDLSR
jgi:hypothetical protein